MYIIELLCSLAAFFITVYILIIVHEFVHFGMHSRRCGIFVERFSIGFGKSLLGKVDRHGIEFIISIIHLCG